MTKGKKIKEGWIAAGLPDNEADRLKELARYKILDTDPNKHFDNITKLASQLLRAVIAGSSYKIGA